MTVQDLVLIWRNRSEDLRRYSESAANAFNTAADELNNALECESSQPLSIGDASVVSGYSREHLRRLVRDGDIPNAGRQNAPAIRRSDLPIKPGHLPEPDSWQKLSKTSREQVARSIAESGRRKR